MYYVNGLMMSNLCGYGNHYVCSLDVYPDCQCPHHEEPTAPEEPDEMAGEDETGTSSIDRNQYKFD